MIIEPTPTHQRSPLRRALRAIGLGTPVVLLVAVVGAGVLGPDPAVPAPAPPAPSAAAVVLVPEPSVAPSGIPVPRPATVDDESRTRFPGAVASLRVRRVPAALVALDRGEARRIVAVAGYLAAWTVPGDCDLPIPGLTGVGCERRAILTEAPWARTGTAGMGGIGAVIEAVVPAGVTVPDAALGLVVAEDDPPPVVVIGWFAGAGDACPAARPSCGPTFTIERITWASGRRMGLGHQVAEPLAVDMADPLVADRARTAGRALGPITMLLRLALVDRDALAGLDATAAAGLRARGPRAGDGPVWYLRGLDVPYDPLPDPPYGHREAVVRWAVVDQATGRVLVSGVEPTMATAGRAAGASGRAVGTEPAG